MGLETKIWALRGGGTEKKEEKEKFLLCESIGHRPLGAAAQKVKCDGRTDGRTNGRKKRGVE